MILLPFFYLKVLREELFWVLFESTKSCKVSQKNFS